LVQKSAKLILIVGPSGVGKGTVLKRVLQDNKNLVYSVSVTTRSKRKGELEGTNYFFKTKEEFEDLIKASQFLEWAEFAENKYGTLKETVLSSIQNGKSVILEIELQGAKQIYQVCQQNNFDLEARFIFLYPPSLEELKTRLLSRNTESLEEINLRIDVAKKELLSFEKINWANSYKITNNLVEEACTKISQIIND